MRSRPKVTGNRIELDGRVVSALDYRVTPRGTAVLRVTVECGAPDEPLQLAVMMLGDRATALKAILKPGESVKVIGRLRSVKAAQALRVEQRFEVVAESIEPAGA